MTRSRPKTPADGEAPARPAGPPSPAPSSPVAGGEGGRFPPAQITAGSNPAAAVPSLPGTAVAGPDVPVAAEASSASAAAGNEAPGPGVDEKPAPGSGASTGKTLAERQKQQLAAIRAARSAHAKGKRNQRARPWQGRDPYRKAVPGGRKMPPGGEKR